jgi:hypothetical protein
MKPTRYVKKRSEHFACSNIALAGIFDNQTSTKDQFDELEEFDWIKNMGYKKADQEWTRRGK